MSRRFLLALSAFLLIVGSGSLWLLINITKKKMILRNLLSIPKERRFFWYKLRQSGFEVVKYNYPADFSVDTDGEACNYSLKLDFMAKKNNRKYGCLFSSTTDERELLKLFFIYISVFKIDAVIFYFEDERRFTVWEW